jgi:phage terminase large subunit-like protein
VRAGNQRPRLHQLPGRRRGSAGPDAIAFAVSLGYQLDDWQCWAIDGILSEDEHHRLCVTLALLILPRQNGKNVVLEIVELFAFFILDLPVILHTAHRQDTSADHMMRLRSVIEANPDLDDITEVREANGKERIVRTDTRAEIRFITRSKKIGRGRSPRLVVFDEALYVTDEQIQAIVPSLSAQSMRADLPLMLFTSSAPVPESTVLHRLRTECLRQQDTRWYAEWSAVVGTEPSDVDAWYSTNPGLGVRISEEWIRQNELGIMSTEAFLIERLGVVFDPDTISTELPTWGECLDPQSRRSGPVALAVDVAPGATWSSIGVAGHREDGMLHVELIERLPGTADVVAVLRKLHAAHKVPIHLDPRSEAAGLIADLERAGVPVEKIGTLDLTAACARFKQAAIAGTLRHIGQPVLDSAVASATVRTVGEGWAWSRRSSSLDISPLVAVTIAAHAASTVSAPSFFVY